MNLVTDLPLYEAIRRELQARIESGELQEGDRIVPEIDLAKQLGVSRSTARKALQCLTDDGLISRTAGRGSFVLPRQHRGRVPGSRVLELAFCASEVSAAGGELARGFLCESLAAGCAAVAWPWAQPGDLWPHDASGCAVWAGDKTEALNLYTQEARRRDAPMVLIDGGSADASLDSIAFDHEGLARALASELILKGHRSVGIVTGPMTDPTMRERALSCRAALAGAGVQTGDDLMIVGQSQQLSDLQLDLLAVLGRRDRPTALCCLSEGLSVWLVRAVKELGYTVGHDLDLVLACAGPIEAPGCGCAALDAAAAGREAARMLLRRLENPQLAPQRATTGYRFVTGS